MRKRKRLPEIPVSLLPRRGLPNWARLTPTEIPESLVRMFPPETLRRFAVESGLIERDRVVDPVALFWVLVLSFGIGLQRELEMLRRAYRDLTQTHLAYSSFYDRFTPELVAFLKLCVTHGLGELRAAPGSTLDERLQQFHDLFIQDSSVIRLNAKLAKHWPATRARGNAAGVKVSALISLKANGPRRVELHGERTAEIQTLKVGPWVRDALLLMDLGFYKHQVFARIEENGGFYLTRLKANVNPLFLRSLTVHRGRAIDVAGKTWKEVGPRLTRELLDAEVELAFSRRAYEGKRSGDTLTARMVAVWDEEAGEYHTYLTNVPVEVLTAEEVAELYQVRWDIELLWKEMKSQYSLDKLRTANPVAIEALIWVGLLTLLVSRRINNLVREKAPPEYRMRYTQQRWSILFREQAWRLLDGMLAYLGVAGSAMEVFEVVLGAYVTEAIDPHVHRKRPRQEWVR
ncbi:MAG: IS4 family transposase [Thermoplasmata archaeon]